MNFWSVPHPSLLVAAYFPRAAAFEKKGIVALLPVYQEPRVRELERIVDAVLGGLGFIRRPAHTSHFLKELVERVSSRGPEAKMTEIYRKLGTWPADTIYIIPGAD